MSTRSSGFTRYVCLSCKKSMSPSDLLSGSKIRCFHCGYRTLRKASPEVYGSIKAR